MYSRSARDEEALEPMQPIRRCSRSIYHQHCVFPAVSVGRSRPNVAAVDVLEVPGLSMDIFRVGPSIITVA